MLLTKKTRIVVADHAARNRFRLETILTAAGYQVIGARDGEEALRVGREKAPDLVLLDAIMPRLSGLEVCSLLKGESRFASIPVVLLAPRPRPQDRIAAAAVGADALLPTTVGQEELLAQVGLLLRRRSREEEQYISVEETVMVLARALEAKDPYSEGHLERVSSYALGLGRALDFSPRDLELLHKGSILHDVGKIGIRDDVLFKPGRLTPSQWAHVHTHPIIGETICRPLKATIILAVVRSHHERYDGTGYPDRLAGPAIPLAARLMTVVDAYDALSSDRPYRSRFTPEEAMRVLREGAGQQFDPELVAIFLRLLEEKRLWPLP